MAEQSNRTDRFAKAIINISTIVTNNPLRTPKGEALEGIVYLISGDSYLMMDFKRGVSASNLDNQQVYESCDELIQKILLDQESVGIAADNEKFIQALRERGEFQKTKNVGEELYKADSRELYYFPNAF